MIEPSNCCSCFTTKWSLLSTPEKVKRVSTITFVAAAIVATALFATLINHYGFHSFTSHKIGTISLIATPTALLGIWGSIMAICKYKQSQSTFSKENSVRKEEVFHSVEELLEKDKITNKDNGSLKEIIKRKQTINFISHWHFGELAIQLRVDKITTGMIETELKGENTIKKHLFPSANFKWELNNYRCFSLLDLCVFGWNLEGVKLLLDAGHATYLSKNAFDFLCNELRKGNNRSTEGAGILAALIEKGDDFIIDQDFNFKGSNLSSNWGSILDLFLEIKDKEILKECLQIVLSAASNKSISSKAMQSCTLLTPNEKGEGQGYTLANTMYKALLEHTVYNNLDQLFKEQLKETVEPVLSLSREIRNLPNEDDAIEFLTKLTSMPYNSSGVSKLEPNVFTIQVTIKTLFEKGWTRAIKSALYKLTDNEQAQFFSHGKEDLIFQLVEGNHINIKDESNTIIKSWIDNNYPNLVKYYLEHQKLSVDKLTILLGVAYEKKSLDIFNSILSKIPKESLGDCLPLLKKAIEDKKDEHVKAILQSFAGYAIAEDKLMDLLSLAYEKESLSPFSLLLSQIPKDSYKDFLGKCFPLLKESTENKKDRWVKAIVDTFEKYKLSLDDFEEGKKFLHLAVETSNPTIIQMIGNRMSNCMFQNDAGNTPLHLAVLSSNVEAIIALNNLKMLCGYNLANSSEQTPHELIKNSKLESVKNLNWLVN